MNQSEYFDQNGYVLLTGVIPPEECERLTQHMFDLFDQGKLTKDPQCPLSDSIYGDSEFETMLENLTEPLGKNIGRKLIPTYTYARIYRPGEELKIHRDRPSCEMSATLTLGFKSKAGPWPIYMAHPDSNHDEAQPIQMAPGEMVVYKGCEMDHWRPKFKGEWHVQVFLHYVDADGPYAEWKYDKRSGLGEPPTGGAPDADNADFADFDINQVPPPNFNMIALPPGPREFQYPSYINYDSREPFFKSLMFTKEECEEIINLSKDIYEMPAAVGGNGAGTVAKQVRSADIYNVFLSDESRWLFEKISRQVTIANTDWFDFELSGITHDLQLIHYKASDNTPGHYDWHVDAGPGPSGTRKLSYVVQLSDPSDYEGCELQLKDSAQEVVATKEQGSVHMFPSYTMHRVTPIEKGERWSLVIWVHGSRRFR